MSEEFTAEQIEVLYAAAGQISPAVLSKMSAEGRHEEIVAAYRDGRLGILTGRTVHKPNGDQLTRDDLAQMTSEQIVEAQKAGRLDSLLTGEPEAPPTPAQPVEERAATRAPQPNPSQGASSSGPPPTFQLGRGDLNRMSAAEIVRAQAEGRLSALLEGRNPDWGHA